MRAFKSFGILAVLAFAFVNVGNAAVFSVTNIGPATTPAAKMAAEMLGALERPGTNVKLITPEKWERVAAHRGSTVAVVPVPTTPILVSQSVNIGEYTANGYGSVRLSSIDDNSWAMPVKGLNILSTAGTACANWTTTRVSGTNGHFSTVTNAPEGTTARTPAPTSTGVTAHLNGGPYVFNVTCTDANGNASNTATLTYNIVSLAANMGDFEGNFPAITSGFANFATTPGYKILYSTGAKRLTNFAGPSLRCPVECIFQYADKTRPGGLLSLQPNANNQLIHLAIEDFQFTGDISTLSTGAIMNFKGNSGANTTIRLKNVTCRFTPDQGTRYPRTCLDTSWEAGNGGTYNIENLQAHWVGVGARVYRSGYKFKDLQISHFSINAFGVDGTPDDLTMHDSIWWAPEVSVGGYHADCYQLGNGVSVKNWDIKRLACVMAGGYGSPQGPIFPGHTTRAKGYIDDGTPAHGPGHRVTIPGPNPEPNTFYDPNKNGSQIIVPACGITGATNSRLSNSTTTSGDLSNIPDQICGSPSSLVDVGTYTMENVNLRDIVFTGTEFSGYGASASHGVGGLQQFAYVNQVPLTSYKTLATVNVVGNTLTVFAPTTSNAVYNAGITAGGSGIGYAVTYPGLTGATMYVTARLSGSQFCNLPTDTICTYTLSRTPGNVTGAAASFVPPVGLPPPTQSPQVNVSNSAYPFMHTGSGQSITNGFAGAGLGFPLGGGAYGPPPSNTTVTKVWSWTTAPVAANFDKGAPQANFDAITPSAWLAMDKDQILATYCSILLPKVGGLFDNGDGTYASPFKKVGGVGQWSDGTVITGCN